MLEPHLELLRKTIGSLNEILTTATKNRWVAYAEGKPGDSEIPITLLNGHIAAISVSLTLLRQLHEKESKEGKCLLWD